MLNAAASDTDNLKLSQMIADAIDCAPERRITFADYMNLVLYHPEQGYYATNQVNIGAGGDFVTSPHMGADFGELLAEQFVEMWQRLDYPNPLTLLEMGAGQGLLVQDVARYLHRYHYECFEALDYIVVEASTALIAEQQRRLAPLTKSWQNLRWCTWEEIESESITGCCFSNELVDAFPVHLVTIANGELKEVYVTIRDNSAENHFQFSETISELSTPRLAEYFELIGIDYTTLPEGYRTEVNLAALEWIKTVSDRLHRGYALTIDYGYSAQRYYSPTRSGGTLQCYYRHAYHSDPYINIGMQDITAHADFTALEKMGEQCGLETVGFTQQGLFLMALGMSDRLTNLADPLAVENQTANDILRRREALHALINPMGLGSFGVLVQSKGMNSSHDLLKGFSIPPL